MHYTSQYPSPLGELLLAADDDGLTGVWFVGQKYFARSLAPDSVAREIPLFAQVKQWLALYFAGQEPELEIPIHMVGTAFQKAVWRILRTIPYGQTMTYGEIARRMADIQKVPHMSAQAVGGAVGHNGVSIIIPCHRVIGTDGSLTGYAGGMDKKVALLELEHTDIRYFFNSSQSGPSCRLPSALPKKVSPFL